MSRVRIGVKEADAYRPHSPPSVAPHPASARRRAGGEHPNPTLRRHLALPRRRDCLTPVQAACAVRFRISRAVLHSVATDACPTTFGHRTGLRSLPLSSWVPKMARRRQRTPGVCPGGRRDSDPGRGSEATQGVNAWHAARIWSGRCHPLPSARSLYETRRRLVVDRRSRCRCRSPACATGPRRRGGAWWTDRGPRHRARRILHLSEARAAARSRGESRADRPGRAGA